MAIPIFLRERKIKKRRERRAGRFAMSNLSLARIMYGAAQEQPPYSLAPVSNFPSPLSGSANAAQSASSPDASAESLLHKAWHALTRHN